MTHPPGGVRFGNLRRTRPISRDFGYERGLPVDRLYIETFLKQHRGDIQGRVLEVGDDGYTVKLGGERVTRRDVLHVEARPEATIVDDLASGTHIPSDAFDCVILTQTLHLIFDLQAAVRTLQRILKPGGVLLATVPGISHIDAGEWNSTWYWALTPAAMRRLFTDGFPGPLLQVLAYGNVLTACAFLQGLATEELSAAELATHDPLYPLVVCIRARKAAAGDDAQEVRPIAADA
jgi:SAM-dependent methyltransferase